MVYDCFTFFNELDLLEIRLSELNSHVDKFVLVEATKTFTGKDKELFFEKNKKRFSKFLPKIIHIIVDDMDKAKDVRDLSYYKIYDSPDFNFPARAKEAHQRNAVLRGLTSCKNNDIILISDIDEIPDKKTFGKLNSKSKIKVFEQKFFYYYVNCLSNEPWYGTRAVKMKDLTFPQEIRQSSSHEIIKNGGWHFSYLGGFEKIKEKIDSFCHQEYNKEDITNYKSLAFNIENNLDIFSRPMTFKTIKLDNTFPQPLFKNQKKYKNMIKKYKKVDKNTVLLRSEVYALRNQIFKLKDEKKILEKSKLDLQLSEQKIKLLEIKLDKFNNLALEQNQKLNKIYHSKTWKLLGIYKNIYKLIFSPLSFLK